MLEKNLSNAIKKIVGKKNFLTSENSMAPYKNGWRTQSGDCKGVIIPSSLLEMWKILKILVKNNKIILLQASNTKGSFFSATSTGTGPGLTFQQPNRRENTIILSSVACEPCFLRLREGFDVLHPKMPNKKAPLTHQIYLQF